MRVDILNRLIKYPLFFAPGYMHIFLQNIDLKFYICNSLQINFYHLLFKFFQPHGMEILAKTLNENQK